MSIGIQKTFNLDMVPGGAPPIIHVSAGDVGRPFRAVLLYNGEVYEVQGNRVTIRGTKPDKTVFEYDVDDFEQDDSYADFTIKEQMAIVPGQVICELREYLNDDQIGSANFILDVEQNCFDPDALSESDIATISDYVAETVNEYLEEHPESIVAVPDGGITTAKLADEAVTSAKVDPDFLMEIENAYVTPEQFGAVGDGTTDDTAAIQAAIDSGENVCFGSSVYKLSSSVNVDDKDGWTLDARNVTFLYTGADYAFKFRHIVNSNILFSYIKSSTGGCVKFFGTDNHVGADGTTKRDWSQYVNIHFLELEAANTFDCINVDNEGTNWINEFRVYGGRFKSGRNGLYMLHDSTYGISHWSFYNIGVEGVENGFEFEVGENGTSVSDFLFVGMRQAEATSVFKTTGSVHDFIIIDPDAIPESRFDIDANVTNWLMVLPTYNAVIKDGSFVYYNFDKYWSLDKGITIAENADLNSENYVSPGVYTCNTTAKAATLSNCPVNVAFTMSVRTSNGNYISSGIWNYIIREISPNGSTDIYRQTASSNGSGVWTYGSWYKVVSQKRLEIEQGSFDDTDGTTKTTRTDRSRIAEPLPVNKFEKIKSNTSIYVFCLDSNLSKLSTIPWTNELDFSTLSSDVAYVNLAFKDGNVNTVANGITGIAYGSLC